MNGRLDSYWKMSSPTPKNLYNTSDFDTLKIYIPYIKNEKARITQQYDTKSILKTNSGSGHHTRHNRHVRFFLETSF